MTLSGIDISFYQKATPDLSGLAFCIAKASEALHADPMYSTHLANMRAAGVVTGAYHFNYGGVSTPTAQAQFFLATAGEVDLYVLDIEGVDSETVSTEDIRFSPAEAQEFVAAIHAAGKRVGGYLSESAWATLGYGIVPFDWRWVADYRATTVAAGGPPVPWDIWQYGAAHINGVAVDGDRFAGDQAALNALAGRNDVDPKIDIPAVTVKVAPTTLYNDRLGTSAVPGLWPGGNLGAYSTAAPGSSNPKMSHGPVALRVNRGTATSPTWQVNWVDGAAVTIVDPTPYSAADLQAAETAAATKAEAAGYAAAKAKATSAVESI